MDNPTLARSQRIRLRHIMTIFLSGHPCDKYLHSLSVQVYLIPQNVYGRIEAQEELDLWTERLVPNFATVTMKQAEAELKKRRKRFMQLNDDPL